MSILVLLIVFASGVGIGVLVAKPQSQQAPLASKTATNTPSPASTPIPSPTATPKKKIIFNDPLTAPTHPWNTDGIHCLFKGGSYHLLRDFICPAPIGAQSDVAVSVQVKQVGGADTASFGIALRYAGAGNFYAFEITSNSTWTFYRAVNGKLSTIIAETLNTAIKPGLWTVNTLQASIKGTHLDFFVNGVKVGEANDPTFSAGLVGLIGYENTDVACNNFQVATLT